MFHPMVAGVTIPGMGLFVLILAPYTDRNPSNKPEDRKFAISPDDGPPDVLGRAGDDRLVLPWARVQLRLPLARRPLLRAVRRSDERRHRRRSPSPSWCWPRSPSSSPACAAATPSEAVGLPVPRDQRAATRRPPATARAVDAAPTSGREIERAAAVERREADNELVAGRAQRAGRRGSRPTPRPSASPAASSSTAASSAGFVLRPRRRSAPSCLAFLWPQVTRRLRLEDHASARSPTSRARSTQSSGFHYYPEGRMWITEYPAGGARQGQAGLLAVRARRHGGRARRALPEVRRTSAAACRSCDTSQWFECPCHGSQYNQVGEKKGGPAPRGLDRFAMSVDGGVFTVDTGIIIQGPPIGTNTTGQEAEGPHCITGGGEAPLMLAGQSPQTVHRRGRPLHLDRPRRLVYVFVNIRNSRAEVGSEIELAPNRKPYLADEELEGRSSTARSRSGCSASSSSPSACPSTGWPSRAARTAP